MSPSKHHNTPKSYPKNATSRPPAGTARETVGQSPGPHPTPAARGSKPRKKSRGLAPHGATLLAPDACGHLPQKKTRNPAPDRGCIRRGRRDPQNRDGSRDSGLAEGSLPRLAPGGQRFEQEILFLRSLIDRLSSRRPLNHTYISRYMRLLIQAIAADARIPRHLTDQQEVNALIKKFFHKTVGEGGMTFFDLLPVRMARPGDKWWPWRQLVPLRHRKGFGLMGSQDPRPPGQAEYFANLNAFERGESCYLEDAFDEDSPDDLEFFTDDPDDPDDPDPFPSDPDDDHFPPLDQDEEPSDPTLVIPDSDLVADVEDVSDAPWRESIPRGEAGKPTPSPLMGEDWGEGDPFPNDPDEQSLNSSLPSSRPDHRLDVPHPAPLKTALIPTDSTRPP